MNKCQFCGLDPYEYVDIGVGKIAVAVNCCECGYLMYDKSWSYLRIRLHFAINHLTATIKHILALVCN